LVDQAEVTFANLTLLGPTITETPIEAALQVLGLVALPDVYEGLDGSALDLGFINSVAALEQIIVPPPGTLDKNSSITEVFSLHAAALLTSEFEQVHEFAQPLRRVYQVRSDLMHGRRGAEIQNEAQREAIAIGWGIFPLILRHVVTILTVLGPDNAGGQGSG
jgi:hypothetical protein